MPVAHPAWSARAPIYQVNLRQYTPEGTLAAFEPHLDRIADLLGGQGIVWFMPIQPIGQEQRKGTMGSYYSVRDYTAVNPEFGSLEDFRRVVRRAQSLGLRVIIDWVANHTAWDHPWTREHPEWYLKDEHGRIHSYVYRARPDDPTCEPEYWTDVVGLDWSQPALWNAMQADMEFWLKETGIDGFRCDVAALVPIGFWERMRSRFDQLRADQGGVFMLAEAHEPIHHRAAFDATYDWDLFDQLKAIAAGQADAASLRAWWLRRQAHYGAGAFRLIYTANHDSNSWQGSCRELFGRGLPMPQAQQAFEAMAVLAALLPGQPLIYGGQESFFDKRLAFFEKDPIRWKDRALEDFYRELMRLRRDHPALSNDQGESGSTFEWIDTGNEQVVAFCRSNGARVIRVAVNLSAEHQTLRASALSSSWSRLSSAGSSSLPASSAEPSMLAPFGYWYSA